MNPADTDWGGSAAGRDPSKAQVGSVEVGGYILEVGDPAGTLIRRDRKPTPGSAGSLSDLSDALEEEGSQEGGRTLTEAGADLIDDVSAETAKVEEAVTLGKGLARGEALNPAQLGLEVDALLGLLERLDRQGRWKEALRLARALSTLYSLLRRWAELLLSLRAVLRAGEALGDPRAIGWAKHELGTLKVAAGDVGGAAQSLGDARKIRERVGDRREIAATDRNLQALCEQLRGTPSRPRILRISPPLAVLAALLLLLAGGLAGGLVDRVIAGGDSNSSSNGTGPNSEILSVEIEGDGSGTISSEPPGIDCGNDCEETFSKGKAVTLTADEDDGSIFDGFSPPCDGESPCKLRLDGPRSVKATFATAYTLSITVEGVGTVEGGDAEDPNRIFCPGDSEEDGYGDPVPRAKEDVCEADFAADAVVKLTADAGARWYPEPIEGCDEEADTVCTVTMDSSREVTVVFSPDGPR